MITAAGRGFRRKGFAGIGVDGLAKEAQVTSGAFYSHFPSKDVAFRETLKAGMEDLRAGIEAMQSQHGTEWLHPFVDFYLSEKRTCDLGLSCAMQSLSPEVSRSDPETQAVFRHSVQQVVDQVIKGLPGDNDEDRETKAWRILSILAGSVTLARAVGDVGLANIIARSARVVADQ
ncbi:TetR/AcrR family transcriptional regulator [Asticcacaulis biprosthecium]|uniref:TetR/AcrR family transcriptional regulator n=1 Tax=Asticcacaulis biprosthecium TaxID=76891 RepID=UPI001B7F8EEE|nr:TetR/AcrR family transcriptional regulator [Asticcacaulis biprosthecium]